MSIQSSWTIFQQFCTQIMLPVICYYNKVSIFIRYYPSNILYTLKHFIFHFSYFTFQLPDAKDLHNMSLVGSYGSHLLHSFHPHLLQTLNHHGMLVNGNAAAAASYFAGERAALTKPTASSVLTNFQLPSAFSPPKYIGISLDQVNSKEFSIPDIHPLLFNQTLAIV